MDELHPSIREKARRVETENGTVYDLTGVVDKND